MNECDALAWRWMVKRKNGFGNGDGVEVRGGEASFWLINYNNYSPTVVCVLTRLLRVMVGMAVAQK